MTSSSRLVAAFCLGAFALFAGPARADFLTSYTVTVDAGYSAVTNILMYEQNGVGGGGTTWPFVAAGDGATTQLDNPFPAQHPTVRSLLIGLAEDLPGDPPGQQHVVLMMDDTAAGLAAGIAWGTLFRNTLEDSLIAAIELATSGQDFAIIQPGLDAIGQLVGGDAETGILDGLAQPHSAWFATGGTFTVMSWSDGTEIGRGTSRVVPEPTTLALLALGLGSFRRRRYSRAV